MFLVTWAIFNWYDILLLAIYVFMTAFLPYCLCFDTIKHWDYRGRGFRNEVNHILGFFTDIQTVVVQNLDRIDDAVHEKPKMKLTQKGFNYLNIRLCFGLFGSLYFILLSHLFGEIRFYTQAIAVFGM